MGQIFAICDLMTWKSTGINSSPGATTVPSLATLKQRSQRKLSRKHLYKDQQSDHDLWPCDLKIYRILAFYYCTDFGNSLLKESKDIEQKTFVQRLFDLTFDQVTWKSIRNIYSLWVTTVSSMASGQKILSSQQVVDKPMDKPMTDH